MSDKRIDTLGYSGLDEDDDRSPPQSGMEGGESSVAAKTNPNHTPPRSIRVPDELWHAAMDTASDRGESVSEAINRFLARYVKTAMRDEDALTRTLRRLGA